MSELGCILLLLRIFTVLFAERAVLIQLVNADICVNTGGDQLRGVQQNQTLDIIRLTAEQGQEDPLTSL